MALHIDQIAWHIAIAAKPTKLTRWEYGRLYYSKDSQIHRNNSMVLWFHNLIYETVIPSRQYTECFFLKKNIGPE